MSAYRGITLRLLASVALLSVLVALAGCAQSASETVEPAPHARYGSDRIGYSYWSRHGNVVRTDDEAARAVGFRPAKVTHVNGRRQIGRVAVVGPESDPRAPHWLIEFYDGFEFRQQRMTSAADAARAVRNQDDSDDYADHGLARRVSIRGHDGFAWDKAINEPLETTNGDTVWANMGYAAVYWREGDIFYGVVSHEDVKMSELLRIARSMRLAEEQ